MMKIIHSEIYKFVYDRNQLWNKLYWNTLYFAVILFFIWLIQYLLGNESVRWHYFVLFSFFISFFALYFPLLILYHLQIFISPTKIIYHSLFGDTKIYWSDIIEVREENIDREKFMSNGHYLVIADHQYKAIKIQLTNNKKSVSYVCEQNDLSLVQVIQDHIPGLQIMMPSTKNDSILLDASRLPSLSSYVCFCLFCYMAFSWLCDARSLNIPFYFKLEWINHIFLDYFLWFSLLCIPFYFLRKKWMDYILEKLYDVIFLLFILFFICSSILTAIPLLSQKTVENFTLIKNNEDYQLWKSNSEPEVFIKIKLPYREKLSPIIGSIKQVSIHRGIFGLTSISNKEYQKLKKGS